MGQYIALKSIQIERQGIRYAIEPRSLDGTSSGLFEHEFTPKQEARLFRLQAIRAPEGVEVHEDPTKTQAIDSSNVVEAAPHPLDHDGDGRKGGSKPGPKPKPGSKVPTETKPEIDPLG